ncbi:hypothetical protein HMPREF1580_00670 [Gardnerella vaginalis JCP8070]|nr:hypothetical protein HMPREF1580_00670 [Gardnerella vaginalis JCP8070]
MCKFCDLILLILSLLAGFIAIFECDFCIFNITYKCNFLMLMQCHCNANAMPMQCCIIIVRNKG